MRITTASISQSEDIWSREKRYLVTMGVRTLCFVVAVIVFLTGLPVWLSFSFLGASLFLPYVAVVMANAGATHDPGGPSPFDGFTGVPALEATIVLPPDDGEPVSQA